MPSFPYGDWTFLPDDQPVRQVASTIALIVAACGVPPMAREHGNPRWMFTLVDGHYVPTILVCHN